LAGRAERIDLTGARNGTLQNRVRSYSEVRPRRRLATRRGPDQLREHRCPRRLAGEDRDSYPPHRAGPAALARRRPVRLQRPDRGDPPSGIDVNRRRTSILLVPLNRTQRRHSNATPFFVPARNAGALTRLSLRRAVAGIRQLLAQAVELVVVGEVDDELAAAAAVGLDFDLHAQCQAKLLFQGCNLVAALALGRAAGT